MTDIEFTIEPPTKGVQRQGAHTYYILNRETGEILNESGQYTGMTDETYNVKLPNQNEAFVVVASFRLEGTEHTEPGNIGEVRVDGQIVPFDYEVSTDLENGLILAQGEMGFINPIIKAKDNHPIDMDNVFVGIQSRLL